MKMGSLILHSSAAFQLDVRGSGLPEGLNNDNGVCKFVVSVVWEKGSETVLCYCLALQFTLLCWGVASQRFWLDHVGLSVRRPALNDIWASLT